MTKHEHDATPPARENQTTGEGYPEESQAGLGIDARDHAEDDVTPDDDAPATSPDEDGDPSQATGNPNAAGG